MSKEATISIRIDNKLKSETEDVLRLIGLNHSTAINMFYSQIIMRGGLPFLPHIPNKETLTTFEATDKGEGLTEYETLEDLIKDSKNW